MPPSDFHVLIIGGGSCGLTLAQGLRKANISYKVYERDTAETYHHRPRDWGSLFHWSQKYMERCLPAELWARRQEMYVDQGYDFEQMPKPLLWNALNGEIIRYVDAPACARVSRAKIRRLLAEGLNIEYGKRLGALEFEGANGKVTAVFEDGTRATGDMVIGCDGGKSVVRRFVVGEEAAKGFDTDFHMINHQSTYPNNAEIALALRAKHPVISTSYSPKGGLGALIAILDVPYDKDNRPAPPEQWKFQIHTSWKGFPRKSDFNGDQAQITAFFKDRFSKIAAPHGPAGLEIDPSLPLPLDDGFNFKPVGDFEWDNHEGRVTLAGDSAHAMLPHRGQGLNNALMDSSEIVDAVKRVIAGEVDLKSAIGAYEDEMRPRGAEEVDRTLLQANSSSAKQEESAEDFAALKESPLFTQGFYQHEKKP